MRNVETAPGMIADTRRPAATLLLLAAAAVGCGGDDASSETLRVHRDTVGDTVVVRTLSGSAWGDTARLAEVLRIGRLEGPEAYTFGDVGGLAVGPDGSILVVDRQVPALRKYGPDGRHLADLGRQGGGPGEIGQTDGGVAVLPDGRVALRDPGNARIQLYGPDGEPAGTLPISGNRFTTRPLHADTAGRIWHWSFGSVAGTDRRGNRFLVLDPDVGTRDTVPVPRWSERPPRLEARHESEGGRRVMVSGVPFWPGDSFTVSPFGYLAGGRNDRCGFELLRPSGVLRAVREADRAPIRPEEREARREDLVENMRRTEPGWSWNGPDIPEMKPCFRTILVGNAGRVWLQRHVRAQRAEVADDPRGRPPGAPSGPEIRWREPVVFDVFAPDGRYLGAVRPEVRIELTPRPVLRGDTVWAVTKDELEVPYVVKLLLHRPGEGNAAG